MAKTYRAYVPEQDLLLPPSLRDWLPEDHLAFFVSDLVDQLDLSAITAVYEDEERGYPPYHPVMLTKVLVYAYCAASFRRARFSDGWSRTSRSACWRLATNRTFAPSPIFARRTWRR
jgi:hypothetical protein